MTINLRGHIIKVIKKSCMFSAAMPADFALVYDFFIIYTQCVETQKNRNAYSDTSVTNISSAHP